MSDETTQYAYEDPKIVLRENEGAGLIEFGFLIEGAFVPFGASKLGGFREDIAEAQLHAADEAAASKSKK